jgi:hypothetical protein
MGFFFNFNLKEFLQYYNYIEKGCPKWRTLINPEDISGTTSLCHHYNFIALNHHADGRHAKAMREAMYANYIDIEVRGNSTYLRGINERNRRTVTFCGEKKDTLYWGMLGSSITKGSWEFMLLLDEGQKVLPYEESIWLCMYLQQHPECMNFVHSSCDDSHIMIITRKLISNYNLCDDYTKSMIRNRLLGMFMYRDYQAEGLPWKSLAAEYPELFNVK